MALERARMRDRRPPIAINARPRKRARARAVGRDARRRRREHATRDATFASARARGWSRRARARRARVGPRARRTARATDRAPSRHRLKSIRDTGRRRSGSNCEVRAMRARRDATTIDATIFMRANARSTARERGAGRRAARSNGTAPAPRVATPEVPRGRSRRSRRRRAAARAGRRGVGDGGGNMRGTRAARAGGGARTLGRARTAAGRARAGRAGDIARARRAGRGPEGAGVARRRACAVVDGRWARSRARRAARAAMARRTRRRETDEGATRTGWLASQKRSSRNSDGETRVRCR